LHTTAQKRAARLANQRLARSAFHDTSGTRATTYINPSGCPCGRKVIDTHVHRERPEACYKSALKAFFFKHHGAQLVSTL
jgi:hypothetical protein